MWQIKGNCVSEYGIVMISNYSRTIFRMMFDGTARFTI